MSNYTVYHCHTMLSNPNAGIDSIATFKQYANLAKECGMTALAISEHGCFYEWKHKKDAIEAAGLKYIHACEFYVTESLNEKIRDNYHCVLIAKNKDGFFELNKMSSRAYNREDGHFYYVPRITFAELIGTSNNIIITSACFVKGTRVLTSRGEKNIEDIKSGDLIKNLNGEWEAVNYPTQIGYSGTGYQIELVGDYSPIRCTEDHKFLSISYNNYDKKWVEAKDLCVKQTGSKNVLLFPLNTSYNNNNNTIERCEWDNCIIEAKRSLKTRLPDTIVITPELMRFFGLYLGDGHTSLGNRKRIGVCFRDTEFDLYYKTIILPVEKQLGIKFSVTKRPQKHRVDIASGSIDLVNLFYYLFKNAKADNKFIPERILNIKGELDKELLFGYILSDGCVRQMRSKMLDQKSHRDVVSNRLTISSVSEMLIRQAFNLFRENGIPATIRQVDEWTGKDGTRHKKSFYLECNNSEFNLDIKCNEYSHQDVLSLFDRVKLNNKHLIKLDGTIYYRVQIKGVSTFNIDDTVYCMNTPSHSFVCNDVVVHNCVGGVLCKGNEELKERFIKFLAKNKGRCFLEIQHHNVEKQKIYNQYLYELSRQINVPLITGTDFHCANKLQEKARKVLQAGKRVVFNDDEAQWDLTWKSYDELVEAYRIQDALPESAYLEAIQNTNVMADMVQPFTLDTSFKFPKIYDDSEKILRDKLFNPQAVGSIVSEGFSEDDVRNRLNHEFKTFKAIDSVDYIILADYISRWEKDHGFYTGPARGSAASSLALYSLGVTEVNPLKYGFHFWRFMDESKYSLPDIDTDQYSKDRDATKRWMLKDHLDLPNIKTSEIITFNTIALRGAIRDIGRGLDMPLETVDEIAKAVYEATEGENKVTTIDDSWRKKYPKLFEIVDLVQGTVTSLGSHPSGVLVADRDIESELGICTLAGDEYPVCVLNMKELDSLNWVKMDELALDNVGVINKCCDVAGIERISPKNLTFDDDKVFESIKNDTSLIFQLNSNYGQQTIKKILSPASWNRIHHDYPSITKFDIITFVSGLIRPCGKDVYDNAVNGIGYHSGVKEIDDLLASTMGYPILQEPIMEFVMKFCGYTFLEADKLRKIIGKKLGTKEQLPIIKQRFEENGKVRLGLSQEKSDEIMDIFLGCVLNATRYSFSLVHAVSYTSISYECAWLRYYYPLEYICCCLNIFVDDEEKTNEASEYAKSIKVKIKKPKFRYSKAEYFVDKESNSIYKGIGSVKFMNQSCADDLYNLRDNHYNSFVDLLRDIYEKTSVNSRQLDILIKLDFFDEFGNAKELLRLVKMYDMFGTAKTLKKEKLANSDVVRAIVERHSIGVTKAGKESKSYTQLDNSAIMNECETLIMSLGIKPMTIKERAEIQKEYMGYVDIATGKQEDRPKLYILDVKTLKSKTTGKTWARQITAQSIGSGKQSNYTITSKNYHEEFQVGDVILCKHLEKQKDYWHITNYEVLVNI